MDLKGFTVLEVITAIFILMIGVGASLSLMHQTLSATSIIEQRLIASYLTQEGIEIVRSLRDNAWLEQRANPSIDWDKYIPEAGVFETDYLIQDELNNANHPYNGTKLSLDPATGFYRYLPIGVGIETKFDRKISIDKTVPETIKVLVQVNWEERGRSHTFEAVEYLTNWR